MAEQTEKNLTRCTVCDAPVKPNEALYPKEVAEQGVHFCSSGCQTQHERKAAPPKQELENEAGRTDGANPDLPKQDAAAPTPKK